MLQHHCLRQLDLLSSYKLTYKSGNLNIVQLTKTYVIHAEVGFLQPHLSKESLQSDWNV